MLEDRKLFHYFNEPFIKTLQNMMTNSLLAKEWYHFLSV